MKLLFFLCALVAVVAATYGNANTFSAPQRFLGRNRVVDDFDVPRHSRGHRWHRRGHRGNHFWPPSTSDSYSGEWDSRSAEFDGFIYLPSITGTANTGNAAQDSASSSYGSASNDAPAATAYGTAAQDPAQPGY